MKQMVLTMKGNKSAFGETLWREFNTTTHREYRNTPDVMTNEQMLKRARRLWRSGSAVQVRYW